MSVEIKEVKTKSDIKQFVKLPFEIYKNNKFWVPPIIADEQKALTSETNPAFDFSDAKFFLAFKNGECLGRVGAIINKSYNEKVNEKYGRINRMEFFDDFEVSSALLDKVIVWFKEKGMNKIHGPLGFTNLDTQGLLIEGFDHLPSVASVYHHAYYQEHFNKMGFEKENDWVEFRLTIGEQATKKATRGAALITSRYGFEVLKFNTTKELEPYGKEVFKILNEAFQELPYVTKFNDKMIGLYSKKYFKIIDPKYVRLIKDGDKLIAFVVGMPSLSEAMQKVKGKLFPFGFLKIMKALKTPTVIDTLLTGVMPEYHSKGAAVILYAELQNEMLNNGLNTIETTGIFEDNNAVISNWKNYEHIQHKRRRCYVKSI
jgi:hypothetical protein